MTGPTPDPVVSWTARSETDLPRGREWLTDRERGWHGAMRFPKRANEYLVARWTAKAAVVSVLGGVRPGDVEIRHRKGGAPVAFVAGEAPGLEISMSDRAGWAIAAVCAGCVIGCDLELVEPRSERFITDYLTGDESRWVRSAPGPDAVFERANLVWSAKESALKVMQTGLRRDTREVEVSFPNCAPAGGGGDWQALLVEHESGPVFRGWWQRFGSFVLTFASERPTPPPAYASGVPPLGTAQPTHTWCTGTRL